MSVFSFYGVTTGGSSIMRLFPLWAAHLGLDARIEGTDLPIHADPEIYRARVQQLEDDPEELGALVTTHKIDLYEACRDMFDEIDPLALLCGETSCLSKRAGRLRAHAKDPISAGQSLDEIVPVGYFAQTGGEVLCLGAGGSAIAIALHLLTRREPDDRPRRFVVVNRSEPRLTGLKMIVDQLEHDVPFTYVANEAPELNDDLIEQLADHSLVINATGRGKDTPGSPISDAGRFPQHGIAWELNYRGELDFLHQAEAQAQSRGVTVHDGWSYFIYGWTAVISEVFNLELGPSELAALTQIANDFRGGLAAAV